MAVAKAHRFDGVRSVAAMYLLHALNIGLPILTLPFLTRSLGSEAFGAYGLVLSLVAVGVIVIEYGYGVAGTRLLSQGRRDDHRLVLGRVLAWQFGHAVIWLPILLMVLLSVRMLGQPISGLAMLLAALITLHSALTPLWYFVAHSQVSMLLVPTLLAKTGFMILVAGVLPFAPSLELALFAYLVSWCWILPTLLRAKAQVGRFWRADTWVDRMRSWRTHAAIPVQRIGSMLYTQLPTLFVAAWFGLTSAGWYFLADRIVVGVIGLFVPLTAHLLPSQLSSATVTATVADRRRLQWQIGAVLMAALVATVLLMLSASWICRLLGGEQFVGAGLLLMYLAPMVWLSTANTLLMNALYARQGEGSIARLVWLVSALYLMVLLVVGPGSVEWFAACRTAVELLTLFGLAFVWWRRR